MASGFQNTNFKSKDKAQLSGTESVSHEGQILVVADTGQANTFAGRFIANLSSNNANVGIAVGVYAKTTIQGLGSAVSNLAAAIYGSLDYSGGANTNANTTFVLVLDKVGDAANSGAAGPIAYIGIGEVKFDANSTLAPVQFLFDIGRNGAFLQANTGVVTTGYANATNKGGSLKIRVNGVTKYIGLSNSNDG